jgi:hypothetical protein
MTDSDEMRDLMEFQSSDYRSGLALVMELARRARPAWHSWAACKGSGVDFQSRRRQDRAEALALCASCPVIADCRQWAHEIDDGFSVLGGETPGARRDAIAESRRRVRQERAS